MVWKFNYFWKQGGGTSGGNSGRRRNLFFFFFFFFFFFLYIWRGRWRLTRNAAPSFFFLTTLWPVWTQKPLFPRGFLGEMTSHPLVVQPHEREKGSSSSSSLFFFNPAPLGHTVCARSVNSVSFQSATGGLQKMSSALFLEQKDEKKAPHHIVWKLIILKITKKGKSTSEKISSIRRPWGMHARTRG